MTPASLRTHALKPSTSPHADSAFAADPEFLTANFTNYRSLTREHFASRPQTFEFKDATLSK
jgi:hypothetical protein